MPFSIIVLLFSPILGQMPPGNLTDLTQCKVSLLGVEYLGNIASTESNVRCQTWNSNNPHKVDPNLTDDKFPLSSKEDSKNYCRNPDRKLTGPWCYTMNEDLIDDNCAVPLCSFSQCKITGAGMEYGGTRDRGVSDRKCLKWDKKRTKVFANGNYIMYPKFPPSHFPEGSVSIAKKYCRNPNADSGGPWCFVENQEGGYMEREYCDIPFCYDPECSVFAKNSKTYMHYTDFNGTALTDIKFSIKLWNSDDFNEASARLVLSVLALPLTGQEIEDLGVGIEIFISNKESALRFGNKDKPEFEPTPGILTSTNFTTFTLNWDRGFITLGVERRRKPIFLAEIKTKGNLMGVDKDRFNFYSIQGTNVLWSFPFCLDDDDCDVHTTTGGEFQQFWPLRQKDIGFDLYFHLRGFYSASVLFTPAPTIEYPNLKVIFAGLNGLTRVIVTEYLGGKKEVLLQLKLEDIIDYWEWREFSISFFANNLHIYMKKAIGMHTLLETSREVFRVMRWFSVSSENSIAHWSFYCQPPHFAQPPPAFLPECAINSKDPAYAGTQDVTSSGLPCLPWSGSKMIPKDVLSTFTNETLRLESRNYCRDPANSGNGTFCFALDQYQKQVKKQFCELRKCKSQLCKMAGTGNDFIGQLTITRSGRECDFWDVTNSSVHQHFIYNNTYFPELNSTQAKNFCRNPIRDISGSWCFTKDPQVVQDVCAVRDCDRPEELIIIVSTNKTGRRVYVLPQWREEGLHGGLRFSLKGWNPDIPSGIIFSIYPKEGNDEMALIIGAHFNEKVELYLNKKLVESKMFPHLISSGVWTDFWLQMRKGEILLGFRGVSTPFFKWTNPDIAKAFDPVFMSYHSLFHLSSIGVFFHQKDECHTENTTDNDFLKYIPIGLFSDLEGAQHTNLTLTVRWVGEARVSFMSLINNLTSYQIKIDSVSGIIGLQFMKNLTRSTEPQITSLIEKQLPHTVTPRNWTKIYFSWTEEVFDIELNDQLVLHYESSRPIFMYWFSVAAASGWITWSANCKPLDLDGSPIDGGWSSWSPWTCTVSCGGGEGFRTRTCSNPHPNIFGKLCEGNPTATGQRKDGLRNITHVYRGMWKVTRDKKIEIALKFLKQDQEKHLKSYLSLTGQWTFVKSPFIVRFYGIALQSNDVSIVMEYFKLGPLDQYLRHNESIIKTVDLIEATSHLASAVWHLRENDIVHGRIRCRKLMVHAHDDSSFTVKLTDNAVQTCYEPSEVHWIAVECYTSEKRTAAADVWAMATTIYEMFTYGRELPTGDYAKMMNRYLNGDRLLRPAGCPEEIYTLLTECWHANPKTRKQSQEVSREVNHLLYQVYNSRKNHAYDVVGRTATNHCLSSSDHKLCDLVSASDLDDTSTMRYTGSLLGASSQQWMLNSDGCDESRDLSHLLSNLTVSTLASSEDSLTSVQSIFELDDSHAVVLKGCIGQGNFGQVFKGILESYSDNSFEPIMVAVKKVKGSTLSSIEDFEREINIMKGLKHPNIVHILGVLRDPDLQLVMEYVPDGCLQAHLKHKKDELQIPLLLKYASDIAQGMDYLGTKNIVHRDLAARNILVVERSHVKISDFGLAQFIGSDDYYTVRNRNRELPLKWYAPESFGFEGKFSVRSDVWSYGVTLYEMFAYGDSPPELGNLDSAPEGQEQASLQKSMLDAIYRGARYPCPEHCPQAVYFNVIKPCWELDPHARPTFKDLIAEVDKLKSHY
ncbi:uncharacterized protein [Euwallacea similis]|uniref:uncharacterized protein n=1 Tax=Euwallacea similis TaxID=1736056 RepID=UPI00344F8154